MFELYDSNEIAVYNEGILKTHNDHPQEILIIDDDLDFRLSLAELLVTQGYRVSTAKNGSVALEQLRHSDHLPSLILLDMEMPEINGWEFSREQKHDEMLAHIPLVVISGHLLEKEKIKEMGINAYLSKPLDRLETLHVIERLV
jgi:chemosensory pili system protein ChpA (sensor histidine kinase/response regulator)